MVGKDFNNRQMRVGSAPASSRDQNKVRSNQNRPSSGQTKGSVPPQKKSPSYNNQMKKATIPTITKITNSSNDAITYINKNHLPINQNLTLRIDNNPGKLGFQEKKILLKANDNTRESYSNEERISQNKPIINNKNLAIIEEAKIKNQADYIKCYSCKKTHNQVFKTTKCANHTYCLNCIKKIGVYSCENCNKYFENLLKINCPKNVCFICKDDFLSSYFKCKSHSYCLTCSAFLAKNNFSYIDKVYNCEACRKIFQNNSLLKETTSEKNIKPFSQPNSNSPNTIDIKALEYANGVNLKEFSSVSNFGMNAYKFECCQNNSGKKFKTPRCLDHKYCDHCIVHGSIYVKCEACQIYFESINRPKNSNTYQCSLCKIAPIDSPIKCRFHQYCGYCYTFLKNNDYAHILNVARCEDCNKCLKALKIVAFQKQIQRPDPSITIQNNRSYAKAPLSSQREEKKVIASARGVSSAPYSRNSTLIQNIKPTCVCCHSSGNFIYKTPRCTKHEYCSNCFEKRPEIRCEFCSMFFDSLKRGHNPQVLTCSLCKLSPNSPNLKCGHKYCQYCSMFLAQNDYSHIKIVHNCQECNIYINEIKNKNSSSPKINNSQEIKQQAANVIPHSIEYRSTNLIPKSNEANLLISQNLLDQNLNKHHFIAQVNNNPYFKNPEPNKQNGPVRPGTYNQVLSPRSNNTNPQILYETAPPRPVTHNPNYSVKLQTAEYPIIAPSYQSVRAVSCNPNSLLTIDSNLLAKCSNCPERENVKGFLCNHNICIKCLVHICCSQIDYFVKACKQNDPKSIYRFFYYCPLNSCNQKISVPTKMILLNLKKFLCNPSISARYEQFRYFAQPDGLNTAWIIYLDGLDS